MCATPSAALALADGPLEGALALPSVDVSRVSVFARLTDLHIKLTHTPHMEVFW